MRRLRVIWGVGLCLGLAGCAGTRQGLVLGPVTMPGGATGHSHSHLTSLLRPKTQADGKANAPCGCGPTVPTGTAEGPTTAMAPGSPAPSPRFFPPLDARGEGAKDLKGTARPDPLGVSTTSNVAEPGRETETPVSNDSEALRASSEGEGEEEGPTRLPLTVEISVPPDAGPAGPVATVTVDDEVPTGSIERVPVPVTVSDERETPAEGSWPAIPQTPVSRTEGPQPPTTALAPAPASASGPGPVQPRPDGPTALELEEDPVLAGRPRLRHDGTVTPRPAGGDPTSYGPDPTFPASYYSGGSAPTSVPKTREVWPTQPPRRPSLLSRLIRRFRGDVAEGAAVPASAPAPAAASARGEPRHLAERGRGVERIAADRLDEAPQR